MSYVLCGQYISLGFVDSHENVELVQNKISKLFAMHVAENDISERDPLFKEAAEIIVNAQQGSASLLQRKMKLGYNRAGRIIDQLEAAGIVGPFEGSKARSVNIKDLIDLDELLK